MAGSNRKDLLTPSSLVFRLTGQGRVSQKWQLLDLGMERIIIKNKL
jgi:hypothetical protein